MINGEAYVPVADVARALGQTVSKRPDGFAIAAAGGANQLGSRQGKIGDVVFTGEFRFQVLDVQLVPSYTSRFAQRPFTTEATGAEQLAVVTCRVKNGTKTRQELVYDIGRYGGPNTALTDTDEHSYLPWNGGAGLPYDVHRDEGAPVGAYLLPGAAQDFAIVFSIPQSATPKDLVFSLLKYDDRIDNVKKAVDVRISLQK